MIYVMIRHTSIWISTIFRVISVLNMLNDENKSEKADIFGTITTFPNTSREVIQPNSKGFSTFPIKIR